MAGVWRVANIEQFITFWVICVFSISVFSLVSTLLYGRGSQRRPTLPHPG